MTNIAASGERVNRHVHYIEVKQHVNRLIDNVIRNITDLYLIYTKAK